jgi:L-fucose mutarotase
MHGEPFVHRREDRSVPATGFVIKPVPNKGRPRQPRKEDTMLVGISPVVGPDLLAALCRMGHGDEIVLADAHFPGESVNPRVLRADGLKIADLLDGILPLFALDTYVDSPLVMMAPVEGDALDPEVEASYRRTVDRHAPAAPPIQRIDRFAFYDRAREAFAVVMTGETAKYGNIILKKGVTPC